MSRNKESRKQLISDYQERERVMGVYQIKNETNGRIYIDGSSNMGNVWNKEKFVLNLGTHMNKALQSEWNEFGEEQFSFAILETLKHELPVRHDYKDVFAAEGREPADMVRLYNRMVNELKEQWLEKLQPYGADGYH